MKSFMYGSLSQFSKFKPRKESLSPVIWLISRELWAKQTWGNCDFICMFAKYANQYRKTLIPEATHEILKQSDFGEL